MRHCSVSLAFQWGAVWQFQSCPEIRFWCPNTINRALLAQFWTSITPRSLRKSPFSYKARLNTAKALHAHPDLVAEAGPPKLPPVGKLRHGAGQPFGQPAAPRGPHNPLLLGSNLGLRCWQSSSPCNPPLPRSSSPSISVAAPLLAYHGKATLGKYALCFERPIMQFSSWKRGGKPSPCEQPDLRRPQASARRARGVLPRPETSSGERGEGKKPRPGNGLCLRGAGRRREEPAAAG